MLAADGLFNARGRFRRGALVRDSTAGRKGILLSFLFLWFDTRGGVLSILFSSSFFLFRPSLHLDYKSPIDGEWHNVEPMAIFKF